MKSFEDFGTQTSDRRRAARRASQATIQVRLETQVLSGPVENLSQTGALFFGGEPLRVTVEIQDEGGTRTLAGRLVRAQRMTGEQMGWAVEFDPQ